MENNPYLNKLVGLPSGEKDLENKLSDFIKKGVEKDGGRFLEGYELEKTSEELEIINFTTEQADSIADKYSAKPVTIPLNNIHIVAAGGTEAITKSCEGAAYSPKTHRITLDRQPTKTWFSVNLFHELLHAKSYSALQLTKTAEGVELLPYRSGMTVYSRDGKTASMERLSEAVTEYLTKEFYENVVVGNPIFESEKDVPFEVHRLDELSYFENVVSKIRDRHPNLYQSKEAVIEEFIKAEFSGNLVKICRLMEDTFGKETLRGDTRSIE